MIMKIKLSLLLYLVILVLQYGFAAAGSIEVSASSGIASIKEAIAKAQPGDTIVLNGGVCKEGNIIIDKPLSVIGRNNPVIDGEHKYEIFSVQADHVLISNITFQ